MGTSCFPNIEILIKLLRLVIPMPPENFETNKEDEININADISSTRFRKNKPERQQPDRK